MNSKEEIFINELLSSKRGRLHHFPDKQLAEQFVIDLFHFLFVNQGKNESGFRILSDKYVQLINTLAVLLSESEHDEIRVKQAIEKYFDELPAIYQSLLKDAEAILAFDPAANNLEEVILAYPGFYATAVYRFSHQVWGQGFIVLARLFSEYAHSRTGIDIHPAAVIGQSFAIDHGTGIVIGETSIIGDYVKLYQGVTLGAMNVSKEYASTKRHPTIEDGVIIYSGATILGGATVIGSGSIIGGNVWLTSSVPPDSVVYHKSEIKIKDKNPFPEPFNFII